METATLTSSGLFRAFRLFAQFALAALIAVARLVSPAYTDDAFARLSPAILSSGGGSVGSIRFSADVAAGQGAVGKSSGVNFAVSFGYYNSFDVDVRPPRTSLTLSGASFESGGKTYVNAATEIALFAVDDLIAVGDAEGFGVKETIYRIDGRPPAVYALPFTLGDFPDADYPVSFYSVDSLGNTEAARIRKLSLDTTPPLTAISVGEPKFEAFGVFHISPETPITLSSVDPEVAGVASGAEVIEYSLDDGAYEVYSQSINLPEGTRNLKYRSRDKAGNIEAVRYIAVAVTRLADYTVASTENLEITGQAKVTGNIAANETAQISGNAKLTGGVTASTVTQSGNAQITGEIRILNPGINPAALDLNALREIVVARNDNDKISPTSRGKQALDENGILKLSSRDTLTITTGTYYFKGMEISARAQLYLDGRVNILLDGQMAIAGQSEIYTNGTLFETVIYQASTAPVSISGKGRLDAIIYAPQSAVEVTGQGISLGNILAKNVKIAGEAEVIGALEREIRLVASATKPAPVSMRANDIYDFVLRDAYAYPNPARGGVNPKIRLETGVADSVEIKIYNVAAELVAEGRLDGTSYKTSGGVCYYEQPIDATRFASGVYICHILARKSASPDIKVIKNFAVIK